MCRENRMKLARGICISLDLFVLAAAELFFAALLFPLNYRGSSRTELCLKRSDDLIQTKRNALPNEFLINSFGMGVSAAGLPL